MGHLDLRGLESVTSCIPLFFLAMSFVMPGQYRHSAALAVICDTPWCAECSVSNAVCRSAGGIMVRCLYLRTPSLDENVFPVFVIFTDLFKCVFDIVK